METRFLFWILLMVIKDIRSREDDQDWTVWPQWGGGGGSGEEGRESHSEMKWGTTSDQSDTQTKQPEKDEERVSLMQKHKSTWKKGTLKPKDEQTPAAPVRLRSWFSWGSDFSPGIVCTTMRNWLEVVVVASESSERLMTRSLFCWLWRRWRTLHCVFCSAGSPGLQPSTSQREQVQLSGELQSHSVPRFSFLLLI